MSFLLKWILPTATSLILEALLAVLKKLANDSDSNVDDKLVQVLEDEKDNLNILILTEAKRLM